MEEEMTQGQVQPQASSPMPEDDQTATDETTPSVDEQPTEQATVQEESSEPEKPKQTRAEKRIQDLTRKLKERPVPQEDFFDGQDEPLVRPEELETGLDPQELERRVAAKMQNESRKTRAQIKAEIAYENSIKDHESDIEAVSKTIDPKLERIAVRQYEAMNYQVNPYTGQPVFVPTVKLSEIVDMLKGDLENITSDRVAQASKDIARASNESALPASGAPVDHGDDLMRKAIATGSDDDWKEVLKSRL